MAYAAGGLKAISNFGSNTVWYYTSTDTHATIKASGYFNLDYQNMKNGDLILCAGDTDGTPFSSLMAVTSADGATTVEVTDDVSDTA